MGTDPSDFTASLTDEERDVLLTAVDNGYFGRLRETELGEIADELEISETEASERLRRAMTKVFRQNRELFER